MKKKEECEAIIYDVDMNNAFTKEGALHDITILNIIPEQVKLIRYFLGRGELISFPLEWHNKNASEFNSFPPHGIENTNEAKLVDELKEYEDKAIIYHKNSTNAMFAPNMIEDLNEMKNLSEVVVTGCCTDICVLTFVLSLITYFNQNNRDVKVIVVKKATDTYDIKGIHDRDEYNNYAYKIMSLSGTIIVNDLEELKKVETKQLVKRGK